jgi:hypothetical protein
MTPNHRLQPTRSGGRQTLRGRSAHSDIVSPLWQAVKDLPGFSIYCADLPNYGYVVVSANARVFGFAEGIQGVTLRLSPNSAASERQGLGLSQAL